MTATMEEVRAKALALPESERRALAEDLYASVSAGEEDDPEMTEEFRGMLARRIQEVREGRVRMLTKEECLANLRRT